MSDTSETGFRRFEQNLIDVIKESEIKIGYDEGSMQLFYPLMTLNHLLQTDLDEKQMMEYLDNYLYYLHKEGDHVIYHRFKKEDYEDFGF